MDEASGEAAGMRLRVAFDRRLKLEFHGATVTSDAGLLAFRGLDDALGLTMMAVDVLADPRTGRNSLIAQLPQSVFGRLAGYEDENDADHLGRDPAMRWIVGGRAVTDQAASTSQMGRFETSAMTTPTNLTALAGLSGRWIDRAQMQRARTASVLDIDSSVSPTSGAQEGTAYNGRFACTGYSCSSCSTSTAISNDVPSERGTSTARRLARGARPGGGAALWPGPSPTAAR
jgi:hypothetical protein